MPIEHLAFNVADPVAVAAWYGEQFQLRIVRHLPEANQTHFLADSENTVLEIYHHAAYLPDYAAMHPLQFHLAFSSSEPDADRERLISAGASFVSEQKHADGSHLVMLRDPWGHALQLCKRGTPLLG